MIWTAALAPQKHTARTIDQGLWVLFAALLAGRGVHIALAWPYYSDRLLDIPQVWLGGLSGVGALAGGLLALVPLAITSRQSLGAVADKHLPLAAALITSAWLACWVDGAVYGAETAGWWGLPARDEWGILTRRLPVQMAAALLSLALFWFLDLIQRSLKRPGQRASLALLGLGLLVLLTSYWRVDASLTWSGLRPEAWAGMVFSLLGVGAFLISSLTRAGRRTPGATADTDILQNIS